MVQIISVLAEKKFPSSGTNLRKKQTIFLPDLAKKIRDKILLKVHFDKEINCSDNSKNYIWKYPPKLRTVVRRFPLFTTYIKRVIFRTWRRSSRWNDGSRFATQIVLNLRIIPVSGNSGVQLLWLGHFSKVWVPKDLQWSLKMELSWFP